MVDKSFEAEARRQGRAMLWRHFLFILPLLLSLVVIVAAASLGHTDWIRIGIAFGGIVLFMTAIPYWWRFFTQRLYPHLPAVPCPTCGGTAIVKEGGPDTHYYLVCAGCDQQADAKFGSRYSLYGRRKR